MVMMIDDDYDDYDCDDGKTRQDGVDDDDDGD